MRDDRSDRLKQAIAEKQKARNQAHLKGFGGNRFPQTRREMPTDVAERGLRNLARSAAGTE